MTTSRERLLKLISHKIADRVGWAPQTTVTFFAGMPDYAKRFGVNNWLPGTDFLNEDEFNYRVNFFRNVGMDYMAWMPNVYPFEHDSSIKVTETRQGNDMIAEIKTPAGSVQEIKMMSDSAKGVFTKKEFISEPQDIDVYTCLLEHSRVKADYDRTDRESELVGDAGVQLVAGPSSPIQIFELHGCKLEDIILFLADCPDKMEKLFAAMHRIGLEKSRIAAESKHAAFLCAWVIGCSTLSPGIYDRYIKDKILAYHEIFKAKNKLIVSHASGEDLGRMWRYMLDIRLDGIHGFSTTPEGNKDLRRILKEYGNKITVWGSLDSHFLHQATVAQIEQEVRRILGIVLDLRVPFILGSSDDLVPGTPLENLEAVSRTVEKYGKY